MEQIKTKLRYDAMVEYACDMCGCVLGRDELREGMNLSKGKLYVYRWHKGRCPKCGAILTKPVVDDCVVDNMPIIM